MIILIMFMALFFAIKIVAVSRAFYTPDLLELSIDILAAEGLLFGTLLLVGLASTRIENKIIATGCRIAILLVLIASFLDAYLLYAFQTRLSLQYLYQFAAELETTLFFMKLAMLNNGIQYWVILVFSLFLILVYSLRKEVVNRPASVLYSGIAATLLVVGVAGANFGNSVAAADTMDIFKSQGRNRPYSPEFSRVSLQQAGQRLQCQTGSGRGTGKNVIFLILESYSHYHSERLLAESSFTPELDRLSEKAMFYENFHANGYATEGGLIAMFTNNIPFTATQHRKGFNFGYTGHFNPERSLPKTLNDNGYQTEFFTTGDLGFFGKGKWLKHIGFDYVEGSENSFYDGWERFLFDAAADEALYLRLRQRLESIAPETKYFIAIENVSTHKPFLDPVTKTESERKAFQYADRELAGFYRYLEETGFFENGLLFVIGDHRSMTPIQRLEREVYQLRAPAMTPMLIFGMDKGTDNRAFQQVDVMPSLIDYLTDDEYCTTPYQGNFLADAKVEPECIIHAPGLDQNNVYAYCSDHEITIALDGDRTRIANENKPYSRRDDLLGEVNYQRISISAKINFL